MSLKGSLLCGFRADFLLLLPTLLSLKYTFTADSNMIQNHLQPLCAFPRTLHHGAHSTGKHSDYMNSGQCPRPALSFVANLTLLCVVAVMRLIFCLDKV